MKRQPSSRDPNQITQYSHDEENNAQRVTIVGGDFGIADAVTKSLKDLKFDFKYPEAPKFEPFIVEKEVVVKQYEVLQIPHIIREQDFKIIETEKLVTIIEPKIIEIEKPIFIKEIEIKVIEQQIIVKEIKNLDKWLFAFLIINLLGLLLLGIKYG